jgi:phosphate-selective porin OprO and OprP
MLILVVATAASAAAQNLLAARSADGRYQLAFGVSAQLDGRASIDRPLVFSDAFSVRTTRATMFGHMGKFLEFRVVSGSSGRHPALFTAYVDFRISPGFRIRMGKDKTPVGYEQMMSTSYLFFPGRSLASGLVPNRDLGIQAQGDFAAGGLSYAVGAFTAEPDGSSFRLNAHVPNRPDVAGRLIVRPWQTARLRWLQGLGAQIGSSVGSETGAVPSFKTSDGQKYFGYRSDVRADGRRYRLAPAIFYYCGPVGAFAEYTRSVQRVSMDDVETVVAHHAWTASTSVVLTGEPASDRGVRPKRPFNPTHQQWGALQMSARYARLTADRAAFDAGLAEATANGGAASFAVGAHWYPQVYLRYSLAFERTTFVRAATGPRRPERIIWMRAQVVF